MKKNSQNPFPEARRQHIAAIIIRIADFIRGLIVQFLPILIVLIFAGGSRIELVFLVFALATGSISIFLSILHYYRFDFFIKKDALVINRGLLNRTHTSVPFDRIQVVNFEASVIHRLLNVVKVVVETAGSKSSESEIYALSKTDAHALRDYLLEMKEDVMPHTIESADEVSDWANKPPLFSLNIWDLIKIGLTHNHLRSASVMVAVTFGYLSQYWVYLEDLDDLPVLGSALNVLDNIVPSLIIMVVFAVLVLAVLLSIVTTIIRFFALKVINIKGGLKISSGLFSRREFSARNNKLQIFRWNTNPLRRIVGYYSVTMAQASSDDGLDSQSIIIPGCRQSELEILRNQFFGDIELEPNLYFKPDKRMVGRYFIFFALIPVGIAFAINYFIFSTFNWWLLLFLPFIFLMILVYYRKFEMRINGDVISIKRGIIEDSWKLIYLYKIQSISLHQTPYMQQKDLVNVHIHTAAGSLSVPYIKIAEAAALRDFIMYKVESSKKSWI